MKSQFITELHAHLKPGRDDEIWVLDSPLIYYSASLKREIKVPTAFETDLSSVPRIPLVYLLWGGRAHYEGVLHDYEFRIDADPCLSFMGANWIFLESMIARGKRFYVKYPMYSGVVAGGYWSYHKRKVGDSL